MKSICIVVLGLSCAQLALGGAHAHGVATEESSRELMLLAKPLRLPVVPPVQGTGTDGLPELPKVQTLVGSFLKEEKAVNTETKTFFGRAQMIQKEEMKKLERLKFAYDQKLKTQEKGSQALVKTNAGLARTIMAQNRANEQMKVQLKHLDERIKARRQQLQALEQRFLDGRQFMKSILAKSDDSGEMSLLETSKGQSLPSKPKAENEAKLETQKQTAKEPQVSEQEEETATVDTLENQMSFIEVNSETKTVSSSATQNDLMAGLANLVNNQLKKTLQKKAMNTQKTKTSHKRVLRHTKAEVQPHTQEPVAHKALEAASTPEPEMIDGIAIPDFSAVEALAQVQPPLPKAEVQPAMQAEVQPVAEVQPQMPKAGVQPAMPQVEAQPPAEVQPQMPKAQAQPPTPEIPQQHVPEAQAQPPTPEAEEPLAMPDISAVEELAETETTPMPKVQVQVPMRKVQAQPPAPPQQLRRRLEVQVKSPTPKASLQAPVPEAKPTEVEVMKAKEDADTVADDKFINLLRDGLRALRAAAKKGEAALKAKFQDSYMVGVVRQKALLQQQAVLKSSLNSLNGKSTQLHHAAAVLKARLSGLEKNLRQGGALLGGLAKVVTARVEDVPKTIQAQAAVSAKIVGSTAESSP